MLVVLLYWSLFKFPQDVYFFFPLLPWELFLLMKLCSTLQRHLCDKNRMTKLTSSAWSSMLSILHFKKAKIFKACFRTFVLDCFQLFYWRRGKVMILTREFFFLKDMCQGIGLYFVSINWFVHSFNKYWLWAWLHAISCTRNTGRNLIRI